MPDMTPERARDLTRELTREPLPGSGLSVLIPAFNSGGDLAELLPAFSWAGEVVVVDSFSTDDTVPVALSHGARVIQHEYINSARQKNWAIPQCAHDWILLVDTDERLPLALQVEIQTLLQQGIPPDIDAYRVARQTLFLGQWLRTMNLWPDYQTRLFRKSVGRYEAKEVHADVVVPGRVLTLQQPLIHHATPTLSKQIGLLDRYSRYQADELVKHGRRFRWRDLLWRPPAAFVYYLIWKRGFLDGFRGVFVAFHAMAFSFFTYAKLWEKEWLAGRRR